MYFQNTFSSPIKSLGNAARKLLESKNKNFVFISPSKRAPKRAVLCQVPDQSERVERGAFCSRLSFSLK